MVHVRLEEDLHRRLRILVATADESIQEFVSHLILREVERCESNEQGPSFDTEEPKS